jgi:drug/metabolite transporter (DMT)-like permease
MKFVRRYRAELLLLVTAAFWGLAFVPQRVAMDTMGPLTFNAARFMLGGMILLPLIWIGKRRQAARTGNGRAFRSSVIGGVLAGTALFFAAAAQQIGLVYTTASKAGFITGLYVILVPLIGIFLGKRAGKSIWAGGVLSLIGLYFLSVHGRQSVNQGDVWVLVSAFFWAVQIHIIDQYARQIPALVLAAVQFLSCAVLSGAAALLFETQPVVWTTPGVLSVLYVGIFSTALCFSLQVYAQQLSQAGQAAVIMNLESVFAALAGWLLLQESLPPRGILGAVLMFAGMAAAEWEPRKSTPSEEAGEAG